MTNQDASYLLRRTKAGDDEAAAELFGRFVDRLVGLAKSRLSPKLARRVDPEDVVQSAYRSFFRRTQAGNFEVDDAEQLWRLLAAITINKVRRTVKRNTAQRRDVGAEESVASDLQPYLVGPEAIAREPSPEEANVLVEEMQRMLADLTPMQRGVLSLRLQRYSTEEVACEIGCSERSVYRAIEQVQADLLQRLYDEVD